LLNNYFQLKVNINFKSIYLITFVIGGFLNNPDLKFFQSVKITEEKITTNIIIPTLIFVFILLGKIQFFKGSDFLYLFINENLFLSF